MNTRKALLIWIAITLGAGLFSLAGWGFRLAMVPERDDAVTVQQNREAAQEEFRYLYQSYKATLSQTRAIEGSTDSDYQVRANLAGLKAFCADVVTTYNSENRDLPPLDLPALLDPTTCR